MGASVIETHISTVFFVGDHAYKLKKPVTFDFVDQSTRARRAELCHREVLLNRRLAPDVYEGVATVLAPSQTPCEDLVVMRRLPSERRLSHLISEGDPGLDCAIDQIAAVLATFHAGAERNPQVERSGSQLAVAELWDANFRQLDRFAGTILDSELIASCRVSSSQFLQGRADLFDERIAGGNVCDGHGDLLADDIFVLDDGPRIIDCLEFDERLRHGDVVADLAFLVMDLEHRGAAGLARRLISAYEAASGSTIPPALLHLYVAYRAQVRALVACVRAEQAGAEGDPLAVEAEDRARALLQLSAAHLAAAMPKLILVGGLPGTGKSTLARGLGDALGATVLRSDVIRKELAGMAPWVSGASEFGTGLYTPEQLERTYVELLDRAGRELSLGRTVVVDASFIDASERDIARRAAEHAAADLVELRCALPAAEAHRRIEARAGNDDDPSDADPLVAARMAVIEHPWPESVAISTAGQPADAVRAALAAIGGAG